MNIPNQTFIQLYDVIMDQEDLTFSESVLLCKLIALDNAPKGCIISNDTLAENMKTSVSSIKRMLKTLKDKDYITPTYTKKHGFVDNRKIEFTLKTKLLLGVTTGIPQPKYAIRNQQQKSQQKQKQQQKSQPTGYKYDINSLIKKMEIEAMNENEYGFFGNDNKEIASEIDF